MGEEDAADPFDLLQPIPAKPKPAAVPDSEPKASSPGSGNGAVPMGPGANAQRDAMRDAIANKMDEMLDARLELYTGQILDALKAMNARLDVLETAVRGGTATLRKETRELRDDVAALDEKCARASTRTSLVSEPAVAEVDEEATHTADLTPTPKPASLASVPSALPTARLAEPAVDRGRGPGPGPGPEAGAAAASAPPPEAEPPAPVAPPVASPQTQTQWAQAQRGASPATEGSPYGAAPGGGPSPYGAPGPALGSPAYASYQQPQRSPGPGPGPPPPPDRGYPPYPPRHYPPPPGGAGGAGGGPPHHGGGPPPHHGPPGVPFHPPHGGPPPGAPYGPPFPGAGPRAGPASIETRNVKVSMDKIVEDFANMGFTRDQIVGVIRELQDSGQGVDLNVVLDRLMNPRR